MPNRPTPSQIRKARLDAGHTLAQAAELVEVSLRTWQRWEADPTASTHRSMPAGLWKLYLIETAQ